MYKLIASRYEGMKEVEKVLLVDTLTMVKKIRNEHYNGGSYIDIDGNEWYTEIIKIEEDEEVTECKKTEKIELRVDSRTKQMIKANAKKLGLTVSAYLTMLANKDKV